MGITLERFPSKGDTVTLQCEERRVTPANGEVDPLVYEVDVLVTTVYLEESIVMGVELHRFCYVKGFKERGRKLPPVNPYGNPKKNGYVINPTTPGAWRCLRRTQGQS